MATKIQNPNPSSLFEASTGSQVGFGEIIEVADEIAERLEKTGVWRIGSEIVEDIEQLRNELNMPQPKANKANELPASTQSVDADREGHGMSIAQSAIHDAPPKAEHDPNVPSIDDISPSVEHDEPHVDQSDSPNLGMTTPEGDPGVVA